jgi:hypothetical protein
MNHFATFTLVTALTLTASVANASSVYDPFSHNGIEYSQWNIIEDDPIEDEREDCRDACFGQVMEDQSEYDKQQAIAFLGLAADYFGCIGMGALGELVTSGWLSDIAILDFLTSFSVEACLASVLWEAYVAGYDFLDAPGFEEFHDCLDACDEAADEASEDEIDEPAEPVEGDDCDSDYDCGSSMYCSTLWLTCQPRLEDGQACLRDDVCINGSCDYDPDAGLLSLFVPVCQ